MSQHRKRPAPVRSSDPTDYGRWIKDTYYEGVAFFTSERNAHSIARRCRILGARCLIENCHRRHVLLMPGDAPDDAVEYAERMAG